MYSFEPSEEQRMLIEFAGRFAADKLRPHGREADEKGKLAPEVIAKGWELGILQASIPPAYGGFGAHSTLNGVLACEELANGDLAGAMAIMAPNLFAIPILLAGSEGQKQTYLPLIAEGDWQPYTAGLIEPQFDFDPNALSTTAIVEGSEIVLNGAKMFVPFAAEAQKLIVYADLDGATQGFIVDREAAGLAVQERQKLLGVHALPVYGLTLSNVRVSEEDRLGGRDGHDFMPVLTALRLANAALALGVARAALAYAVDYAKDREVFGVKVAQKQAIAFMLAEMATEIEAMRLLAWEAAWQCDETRPDAWKQAYLAHTGAGDLAMMVTDRAVQVLGGHGYIREHPVEMWMRNGRGFASFVGLSAV